MSIHIIYHSYSGKTKRIAEQVQEALGGTLTEVSPQKPYSRLSVVPVGCYRALKKIADPVHPEKIDISGSEIVILATPVWAGRPTPVILGALEAVGSLSGKEAYLIVTCNDAKSGREAVQSLTEPLDAKGYTVIGSTVVDRAHLSDPAVLSDLVNTIRSAGSR